ncbi:MAG: hypothetical protein GVY34_00150, partial [Alphaproteobacteria bacterium]|nr:hypothetical protein [Alphaproteobacteria bacterium]
MEFQTILEGCGISAEIVALCLHKPSDQRDRLVLTTLAEQHPEIFDTYQSTHSQQAEATLKSRAFMASFLARGDASLTFIGLYRQAGWVDLSGDEFDQSPQMQTMYRAFSSEGFAARGIDRRARFDLQPETALAELRGRLVVADPGARAYMRRGETTSLPVLEIQRVPDLAPPLPDWRDVTLDADTVRSMPRKWADTLRHWRGIYLIVDESDGARY